MSGGDGVEVLRMDDVRPALLRPRDLVCCLFSWPTDAGGARSCSRHWTIAEHHEVTVLGRPGKGCLLPELGVGFCLASCLVCCVGEDAKHGYLWLLRSGGADCRDAEVGGEGVCPDALARSFVIPEIVVVAAELRSLSLRQMNR